MPHFRHRLLHALTGIILTLPLITSATSGEHAGRLLASHNLPEGITAHYRWEKFLDHPRAVQPNDGIWQLTYDASGNLASQIDPTGATTLTQWRTNYALPEIETDALGNQTVYHYDDWGNLYTWHHVDNYNPKTGKATLELVETPAHVATLPHKGSVGQYQDYHGIVYKS